MVVKKKSTKPKPNKSKVKSKVKTKKSNPRKKSVGGRPPISRKQADEDLIKRCKKRGIEIINRRTGKRLSEETLRHRCTFKNAPLWGGKGDPKVPVVIRKKRRKKRKSEPFKKAPRIIPRHPPQSPISRQSQSLISLQSPQQRRESLPEAITIDRISPKRRIVQPTLILRKIPQSGEMFEGSARVVRFPKNASTAERQRILRRYNSL